MDYKEKYEDALGWAKAIYPNMPKEDKEDMEIIFPELVESEDERIRMWLEGLIETMPDNSIEFRDVRRIDVLHWLEKQGEKPTDEVKPMFREGDWIIRSAKTSEYNTYLIKKVKNYYVCENLKGQRVVFTFNDVHKNFKLWDITKDAKKGDVVVCKGDVKYSNGVKYESICLFNNLDRAFYTLTKFSNGLEEYGIDENICYPDNTIPATKEQKEILFMAMKNARYEWDADKKELNKIEKPTKWSEEDEYMLNETIQHLKELIEIDKAKHCACDVQYYQRDIDWLKSLKEQLNK